MNQTYSNHNQVPNNNKINSNNNYPLQKYQAYNNYGRNNKNSADNYEWGYKVHIDILRNYKRSKPVKIKVVIKQYDITSTPDDMVRN